MRLAQTMYNGGRMLNSMVYDVIVVGGGHAGCEASAASARCGAQTLLLTHRMDKIGEMSCNPSFGGIGKGHLIREVDAMDGLCGRICDKSAITYNALNVGQGPAVLGLRAQIDRKLYKKHMQEEILRNTANLFVMEGSVDDLMVEVGDDGYNRVSGICLNDGNIVSARAVVITTGTFLRGQIFQGLKVIEAGRIGEKAANGLSHTFSKLGFKLGRLRTGTPPRLKMETIDFTKFVKMPPDIVPIPFSFLTEQVWIPPEQQLPTYLGHTNRKVAEIVLANIHKNLQVNSETSGPRYCPSLESKVLKFGNMCHRVFLEHEGLDSDIIYPQGMSMTFEPHTQLEIMRAIPGLEKVEIIQSGYGVQYDFVCPQQLHSTLETKKVRNLFLAGQINGTTGYEEAAAQGILAGINAAAVIQNRQPMTIDRTEGYLGVLVDDLTSLGTKEPYRMFTSRAEFRLHLRPDNADVRLTERARMMNAVSDLRYRKFLEMRKKLEAASEVLKSLEFSLGKWQKLMPGFKSGKNSGRVTSAYELMHRYRISFEQLYSCFPREMLPFVHDKELESRIRTEGAYAKLHQQLSVRMDEIRKECLTAVPDDIDFSSMTGLSIECKEKLETWRPQNLAAASRIPGVTPEALCVLLRHLKKAKPSSVVRHVQNR